MNHLWWYQRPSLLSPCSKRKGCRITWFTWTVEKWMRWTLLGLCFSTGLSNCLSTLTAKSSSAWLRTVTAHAPSSRTATQSVWVISWIASPPYIFSAIRDNLRQQRISVAPWKSQVYDPQPQTRIGLPHSSYHSVRMPYTFGAHQYIEVEQPFNAILVDRPSENAAFILSSILEISVWGLWPLEKPGQLNTQDTHTQSRKKTANNKNTVTNN